MKALTAVLFSARGFHLSVGFYLLGIFVLRLVLFPGASEDDAEQLFYTQSLASGYKPGQPPLYSWIVYVATQAFGVALPVVVAIKFICIAAIYALTWRLARVMTDCAAWAGFAGLCVLGIYVISWDSVLNYSQTVMLAALCLAFVHALLMVARGDGKDWRSFVWLGVVAGAGMLTKYNFAVFIVALGAAALMDRDLRARLLSIKGALALLVALAVFAPHGVWLVTGHLSGAQVSRAVMMDVGSDFPAWVLGLGDLVTSTTAFLSPLVVLVVVFFPKIFRRCAPDGTAQARWSKILQHGFLILIVLATLAIVGSGISKVRNHWFMVLIPFALYATLRISIVYPDLNTRRIRGFIGVLVALALIVPVALSARAIKENRDCGKCKMNVDYALLADEIRNAGFSYGTVLTHGYPTQMAGNLRQYFPASRFVSNRFKTYTPPAGSAADDGQCLAVWRAGYGNSPDVGHMRDALKSNLGVMIGDEDITHTTSIAIAGGAQTLDFAYVLITDTARQGECR